LTIGEPEQIAVDPVDDGHQSHIVVSREEPHYEDRRRWRLRLDHAHNRLKTSRDLVCSRVNVPSGRCIGDVVCASEQNDDFGVDCIQLAVLQTPEDILRLIGAPSEISRVPAEEILFPIGQQVGVVDGAPPSCD
jgi:hypothetical protein